MSPLELAEHLGVSLGKANYCLKELVKKGGKAGNFAANPNKRGYAQLLTISVVKKKAKGTLLVPEED